MITFNEFVLASVCVNTVWIVSGKRGLGKTSLVTYICSFFANKIPKAYFVSGTEGQSGRFSYFVNPFYVHTTFSEQVLEKIVSVQRSVVTPETINKPWINGVLIVLDDLNHIHGLFDRPVMKDIIMNGRNLNITLIVVLQWMMDCRPFVRQNTDYFLTLATYDGRDQERLHDYFFNIFKDFEDFAQVLRKVTEIKGRALVRVNDVNATGYEVTEHVKYAPFPVHSLCELMDIKFGSTSFQQHVPSHFRDTFDKVLYRTRKDADYVTMYNNMYKTTMNPRWKEMADKINEIGFVKFKASMLQGCASATSAGPSRMVGQLVVDTLPRRMAIDNKRHLDEGDEENAEDEHARKRHREYAERERMAVDRKRYLDDDRENETADDHACKRQREYVERVNF